MSRIANYKSKGKEIIDLLRADTKDITSLDDLEYLSALAQRYNVSMNQLVENLLTIYEFNPTKRSSLIHAQHKLDIDGVKNIKYLNSSEAKYKSTN